MTQREPERTAQGNAPVAPAAPYRPPAVLWEQPFVALALVSRPPCDPTSGENCIP